MENENKEINDYLENIEKRLGDNFNSSNKTEWNIIIAYAIIGISAIFGSYIILSILQPFLKYYF